MSNNPFLRDITNSLNDHWKDHPGQRDFFHGTYHLIEGVKWSIGGIFSKSCREKAAADFQRAHDHLIDGENRNDREHYNRSPGKS